jgi:hypothetical protein
MFGIDTAQHDCWNGIPSSQTKGIPNRKANYHSPHTNEKKRANNSLFWKLLKGI